jgi:hypothetical protein
MVLLDNPLVNYHQYICETDGAFRQPPGQFSSKHLWEIWYFKTTSWSIIIKTSVKEMVFLDNPLANYHQTICKRYGTLKQPPGQLSFLENPLVNFF